MLHVAKSSFQYYIRLCFSLILLVCFLFFCFSFFRVCLDFFSFFGILFIVGIIILYVRGVFCVKFKGS